MIPLEDNAADVIGKAQRGLEISDSELAERAGVSSEDVRKVRAGQFDEVVLSRIAPLLNLDARALIDLATGKWKPVEMGLVDGLAQFNTPYDDMTVNAYLVWDPQSRQTVAFDSGGDCSEMLASVERAGLQIELILLTHAHPDHIADLERLKQATGAAIYVPAKESVRGAQSIEEGKSFAVGKLRIKSLSTWGHSPGGMTYFVTGLEQPIAIVGDSLFAGSMGGGSVSYEDALLNNREKILTLLDDTIICPGHGPLTTVGEEKKHNPFFAGLKFHV
ncbi:MAG: MBL fold metallo-hydrolase [Chthoniobacterales bacterium]